MKLYILSIALLLSLSSCSRKNETELFKEGQAAQQKKNVQLALERYQEIVDRFQDSPYADSALYRLAVIYNNDVHDYSKAAQMYYRYYELYPESKDAPTALFLSGFIQNNELHHLDSAKMIYELFLQKYPGHSLVSSAQFELETLGKNPGEFIKKDTLTIKDQSAQKPEKTAK